MIAGAIAATPVAAQGIVVTVPPPVGGQPAQPPPTVESGRQLPGIVVTTPQPQPGAPPPAAKPKADAAKKPKAPAKTAATTPDAAAGAAAGKGAHSIVALVNDEPISTFDLDQRINFAMLSGSGVQDKLRERLKSPTINDQFKAYATKRLEANPPKSREEAQERIKAMQKEFVDSLKRQAAAEARPGARKAALDALIEEKLKLQEGKKLSVVVSDAEISKAIGGIAQRNNMTEAQFAQMLKGQGVDIAVMKSKIMSDMVWREVIRRRFGHTLNPSQYDIDQLVRKSKDQSAADLTELQLQRIVLALPSKVDQKAIASRFDEAEQIRQRFTTCAKMASLAGAVKDARFEDLGRRRASALTEPARSMVLEARDGEMAPPVMAEVGISIFAVCGRSTVKADEQKRQVAMEEASAREMERLAVNHLRDVRQQAQIDYR